MTFEIHNQTGGVINNVAGDQHVHAPQSGIGSAIVTLEQARAAALALETLLGTAALPAQVAAQVQSDVGGLCRELGTSDPDRPRVANVLARIISKVTEVGSFVGSSKEVVGALGVVAEWLGPLGAHLLGSLSGL